MFAVRGNVDRGAWANALPESEIVEAGNGLLYVLHDIGTLALDPPTAGFRAVIYGHSHQPKAETKDGVLYFNPGSAGPRRFSLPVSVGRLTVSGDALEAEIITHESEPPWVRRGEGAIAALTASPTHDLPSRASLSSIPWEINEM